MAILKITGGEVVVDEKWANVLSKWEWHISHGYAVRRIGGRDCKETIYLHRYITMAPKDRHVDHINQNRLDCREDNLRIVLPEKNYYNRGLQKNNKTGFKGVCFDKSRGKYFASISIKGKAKNIGRFNTAEEAARAYDEVARIVHKEYACLNFP